MVAGDSAGHLDAVAHDPALTDEEVVRRPGADARAQSLDLAAQFVVLFRFADHHGHLVHTDRLLDPVIGTLTQGRDRAFLVAHAAQHDQRGGSALGAIAPEERHAVDAGHPNIAQNRP